MSLTLSLPGHQQLESELDAVLASAGIAGPIKIVHRRANRQASTFPSELVTCRTAGGDDLQLFCKYCDPGVNHTLGHRSGVAFETAVYRDILHPLKLSTARYYGQCRDPEGDQTCLVLEGLNEFARLHKSPDTTMMIRAAAWIAHFHAVNESRAVVFGRMLHRYDAAYYAGWALRTAEFAGDWHGQFPWLAELCATFAVFAPRMAAWPVTIIHGELYPCNVLTQGERICPIDWESGAVAPGVIDLATLTENWPGELVTACVREYQRVRWPFAPPQDVDQMLAAARLYLHFRWMGNHPEWTIGERFRWRYEQMRVEGKRLGLL